MFSSIWAPWNDICVKNELRILNFRLFKLDKDVKHLFLNLAAHDGAMLSDDVTMDEYLLKTHASVVMEALGAAVECLEDSALLSTILVTLGQMHAGYHVKPHYLLVSYDFSKFMIWIISGLVL